MSAMNVRATVDAAVGLLSSVEQSTNCDSCGERIIISGPHATEVHHLTYLVKGETRACEKTFCTSSCARRFVGRT